MSVHVRVMLEQYADNVLIGGSFSLFSYVSHVIKSRVQVACHSPNPASLDATACFDSDPGHRYLRRAVVTAAQFPVPRMSPGVQAWCSYYHEHSRAHHARVITGQLAYYHTVLIHLAM